MNRASDTKDNKKGQTNDQIKCDVCNCKYNNKDCACMAKQIVVGPDFATSQSDTVCGTFEKS